MEPLKILLVEDSATMRYAIKKQLQGLGHNAIDEANNGADGLSKARSGTYDVILSDQEMPQMTGLAMTAQLREEGNRTPVIMVAGNDLAKQSAGAQNRPDFFLIKPVTTEQLVMALAAVVKPAPSPTPPPSGGRDTVAVPVATL